MLLQVRVHALHDSKGSEVRVCREGPEQAKGAEASDVRQCKGANPTKSSCLHATPPIHTHANTHTHTCTHAHTHIQTRPHAHTTACTRLCIHALQQLGRGLGLGLLLKAQAPQALERG